MGSFAALRVRAGRTPSVSVRRTDTCSSVYPGIREHQQLSMTLASGVCIVTSVNGVWCLPRNVQDPSASRRGWASKAQVMPIASRQPFDRVARMRGVPDATPCAGIRKPDRR